LHLVELASVVSPRDLFHVTSITGPRRCVPGLPMATYGSPRRLRDVVFFVVARHKRDGAAPALVVLPRVVSLALWIADGRVVPVEHLAVEVPVHPPHPV